MAHTPGPWELSGPDEMPYVRTVREYVKLIADRSRPKRDSKGRDLPPYKITIHTPRPLFFQRTWSDLGPREVANARLIAAAPELLAALEALLDQTDVFAVDRPSLDRYMDDARRAIAKAKGCTEPISLRPGRTP